MNVTLVTTGNISTSPRLVKEADALDSAGHRVRVVAADALPEHAAADRMLMATRRWRLDRVNLRRGDLIGFWHRVLGTLRQRLALRWYDHGRRRLTPFLANRIVSRYAPLLIDRVAAETADLVIGHTLGALPVAVIAARRLGARAGFDIEDFHAGELTDDPRDAAARALVIAVERRYLPTCATVTASSPAIADAIVAAYGIPRPYVVLNTFPRAERRVTPTAPSDPPAAAAAPRPPSLYWYSQVIGAGRGLEDIIDALPQLDPSVHCYLRGSPDAVYVDGLLARASSLGVADRVVLLAPVAPGDLVPRAAEHDIGLALEQPVNRNRDLCATNKIFTYLLAGLAVAATDTTGQRWVMNAAPGAGFVYRPGDAAGLAAGLRQLLETPGALTAARAAAREAADRRFHFEAEAPGLVAYLEGAAR